MTVSNGSTVNHAWTATGLQPEDGYSFTVRILPKDSAHTSTSLEFDPALTTLSRLRCGTPLSDVVPNPLVIEGATAFATASGSNRTAGTILLNCPAATNGGTGHSHISLQDNGVTWAQLLNDGTNSQFTFQPTAPSPLITIAQQTSDAATNNLLIQNQQAFTTATGSNRASGNIVINIQGPTNGGTGHSHISIQDSGTTWLQMLNDGTNSQLAFQSAAVAPKIFQVDNTTASSTAVSTSLQAQNATGTNSTGGQLVLTSGTGTTAAGSVVIQTGGTTRLTANATGVITVGNLSTGIVHADSSGNLTSSNIVVGTDITGGTTGQVLITNGSTPTWTTIGTDGTVSAAGALQINQISGGVSSQVAITNPIAIGSTTATSGSVRLPNNVVGLEARNAAGGADIKLVQTDNSNNVIIGESTNDAGLFLRSHSNTHIQVGTTTLWTFTSTQLQIDSTVSTPSIQQNSTSSGSGTSLTLSAQNATGASNNGGNLNLAAGTSGSATAGAVQLQTAGSTRLTVGSGGVITIANLGTGLVHSDNSGNLTSSTLVNADVSASAAIAVSKLAAGTSAQILQNNGTPTPTWTTVSGDVSITNAGVTTVTALQGNAVQSGALTNLQDGYVLEWVNASSQWQAKPGSSTLVDGQDYAFSNTSSDVSGYDQLFDNATGSEADLSVAVTSGGGKQLIKAFASVASSPQVELIPAGLWEFNLYGYASVLGAFTTNLVVDVYTRTAGGTETLLFTVNSPNLTVTSVGNAINFTYNNQVDTYIANTTRVVVKISAITTSVTSVTAHFVFDGTTHTSLVRTPIAGASLQLGGDLSGTTSSATVLAVNGTTVPATPSANQLIVATNGTTASWTSTLPGNYSFTGTPTFSNTLALNTTGSAASLSISGQTGLLTVTGLASTNRIKTVRDAADTLLELGGSYTPTGTWTSMTLAGGALSGTFTGAPTLSGNVAFTGTPTFSNALALGSSTATTQSVLDNSTKLATTAYVDRYTTAPICEMVEDFDGSFSSSAITVATTAGYRTNWSIQQVVGGTQLAQLQNSTFPNLGDVLLTTSATSGQGIVLGKTSGVWGNLGGNAGWDIHIVAKLGTTSTICFRLGVSSNLTADAPSNWMGVEYDTANTGNTDTKFTWVTRSGGTPSYSTTNAINADATTWHTFRIRSTSAGTILFSVDGGSEASLATNVPTAQMTPFIQLLTRTAGASTAHIDYYSFVMNTTRT